MSIPSNLRYTDSHEWVRKEPDNTLSIGITDHAQEALGDIVFLDLPEAGRTVKAGEIVASNAAAVDAPDSVNSSPYDTWLFKIQPARLDDIDALLDTAAYAKVADAD